MDGGGPPWSGTPPPPAVQILYMPFPPSAICQDTYTLGVHTMSQKLSQLASTVAGAFAEAEQSGGLVENICKAVQKLYKGKPVPKDDGEFIADEVARLRGWSEGSARVRKAECKSIIGQYAKLPDAIARAKKKKFVSFEMAVKLARSLNKGMTPNQAAQALVRRQQRNDSDSRAKADAETARKAAKQSAKKMLEYKALPAKFRSALRELCEEYDIF